MASGSRRAPLGLAALFGVLYFAQGFAEPTAGLIAQPVRSLLRSWGRDAGDIGAFMALLGLPWMIKPLYGLLTDLVPLGGTRRRGWLLLWTGAAALGLAWIGLHPPEEGQAGLLWALLLVPTLGVAFSDVVIDGLMVDVGQPRGLTGPLQSVQWAAIYAATILTGVLGGWLSARGLQATGFLLCAAVAGAAFALSVAFVREPPAAARGPRPRLRDLARGLADRGVLAVGAFLFLWNFNPFSTSVQYVHLTASLRLGEELYGETVSLTAVASVLAAAGYGLICRRVPFRWLVHASIVAGVLSTLAWWAVADAASARAVAFLVGLTYMLATLIQLDLAARHCPLAVAATAFALLMSLCNVSFSASEALGGALYEHLSTLHGTTTAWRAVVAVGAGFTCLCWLVVPWLPREPPPGAAPEGEGPPP